MQSTLYLQEKKELLLPKKTNKYQCLPFLFSKSSVLKFKLYKEILVLCIIIHLNAGQELETEKIWGYVKVNLNFWIILERLKFFFEGWRLKQI